MASPEELYGISTDPELGQRPEDLEPGGQSVDDAVSQFYAYTAREGSKSPEELYGAVETPDITESGFVINEAKKGLIDLLSLPGLAVDAVAGVQNILSDLTDGIVPRQDSPVGGTAQLRRGLDFISGTKELKPPSEEARYMGSIARFTAPTIFTGPFIASIQGLSKLEKTRAILTEVASGVAGGTGAEVGADIAPEIGLTEEQGRMLGGITGSFSPLPIQRAASEVIGRVKGVVSRDTHARMGRSKATSTLELELERHPEATKNLKIYEEDVSNIPGYSTSLGRATGAPGIQSIEKQLAEESSDFLETALKSDREARAAVAAKLEVDFPDAGPDITRTAGKVYSKVLNDLKTKLEKTNKQYTSVADKFVEKPTPEIGARLRELKDVAQKDARQIKNLKYDAVYAKADDLGVVEDVTGIYGYVKGLSKSDASRFQGPNMPRVFNEILKNFEPPKPISSRVGVTGVEVQPKVISFRELHSLIKRTNEDYYASLKGNDPTMTSYLSDLKNQLSTRISKYTDTDYGEVSSLLKDANKFYVNEYQDVFRKGAGAKLGRFNRIEDMTSDEEVVRKIFLGRKKGIEDFRNIYGDSSEAKQLLKDGVLDIFRKMAVKDGEIVESGVRSFRNQYGTKLNELPEIKSMLDDHVQLSKDLAARQATLRNKITSFKGSTLKKLAGVNDVNVLLSQAIKDPKKMKQLSLLAQKEKGGSQALAHSLAVRVSKEDDPYRYLLDNMDVIKPVMNKLGPSHIKNLETIARGTSRIKSTKVPGGVGVAMVAKDPVRETVGTTFASIGSQARSVAQGRVSEYYVMSDIGGKYLFTIKQREYKRLMDMALYDTELALDMAKWTKDVSITKSAVNKMRHHLFASGALANVRFDEETSLPEEY